MANVLTLKKSNCRNCYKCIRHCPVKAIRFSGNQAYIIHDECIYCGQCFVACPQDAKEITSELEKVKVLLQSGAPVIASLAPSFVANYDGAGIGAMRRALTALGFSDVEETALGATIVKREYERMLKEEKRDVVISSSCHAVNLLLQKYFPKLLPCLANILSPMQAHCQDIKRRNPEARTVFIGPCVAKKDEGEHSGGLVDAVLTFEELTHWLADENIAIGAERDFDESSRARFFPTAGGILKSMAQDAPGYTYLTFDGVDNCIAALTDLESGRIHNCFIEMSACVGSCIGGPIMEKFHRSPVMDAMTIAGFAGKKDFDIGQPDSSMLLKPFRPLESALKKPDEYEIASILKQMGKTRPQDELDCGSCGYNTCRDKAVAIYQGKADISMCLPFLKEKAESFSDSIVSNTPNGLIVLNEKLEVQQINHAARKLMNLRSASDILGDKVVRILDPKVFLDVLTTGRNAMDMRVYLAEYEKYVEQTVIYDRDYHLLICILRDVTDEELQRHKKESMEQKTVEIADRVVDKQMRVVQEIASLLGETAAETKIALSKLKESILNE